MKKILSILLIIGAITVGCTKQDNSSYSKYLEEGKTAIANKDYEKGRNFFGLAKEENTVESEANDLYNQTDSLLEAIKSKNNKGYDIAIQLCDITLKIDSQSNIVKDVARDLKKECENLRDEDKKTEDTKDNVSVAEIISSDYRQRAKEAEDIVDKESGIFRYNEILINTLKSYDISDAESAQVVYELSDKLLNDLYKEIKSEWTKEDFEELEEEENDWIKDKLKEEKKLSSNQLMKYQSLVKMTLDRCEELNIYYQNGYLL